MKRFIFCLVLLLCGGIGFTEEKEDVSFAADIPFGEGNISMHFHFNPSTSACAVGEEEYYKTCIPADIEGELIIPDSIAFEGGNRPILWISRGSFQSCPNLTQITLPSNLRSISDLAFQGCTSLCEITFPDSIKTIYPQAFIGCTLCCCICSVFLSVSFRHRKPYLSSLLPARLAFRQIQNPGMKKALCYIINCAYSKGLHFYRHYSVVL